MINFMKVHTCLETCGTKRESDPTTVFSMKCGVCTDDGSKILEMNIGEIRPVQKTGRIFALHFSQLVPVGSYNVYLSDIEFTLR